MTVRRALGLTLVSLTAACSADATPAVSLDAGSDAQPPVDAGIDAFSDGGTVTPCPTTGKGAIVAPDVTCIVAPPTQTGAGASGENAGAFSYALAPNANRKDRLVVFLNGSGGHPQGTIADPTQSFFTAATALGDSVIGLSYASAKAIGLLCATDGCFRGATVMVVREYEAWLLASAHGRASLGGRPIDQSRDAKKRMSTVKAGYKPTVHQLELTQTIDVAKLRELSASFDKLVRSLAKIFDAVDPRPSAAAST